MPLSVVTNTASVNAQRNLSASGTGLDRAMQRLSSGLRINSARDDAAGLSIASRFAAQSRGVAQAIRNSNDGISLAQVAEGALGQSQAIIQRIRELAVQSANDTNGASDRASIQAEVDQLVSEVDRIAETTTFNGRRVLDGSFLGATFQVGANAHEELTVAVDDARASSLGRQALQGGAAGGFAWDTGDLAIDGVTLRSTQSDGVSTVNASASAIAKVAAINDASAFTGVSAFTLSTQVLGGAVAGGTLDSANNFSVNGVTISGVDVLADDADGALRQAINAVSTWTGVVASLDEDGALKLVASDARNIDVQAVGNGALISGIAAQTEYGLLALSSDESFTITQNAAGVAALNVGGGVGDTVVGVSSRYALGSIRVDLPDWAQIAISTADKALAHVAKSRAALGAVQNRLESTVANLATAHENLEAARGRIEDADFASETAQLTRSQILQQAGTSVLAQANQRPQLALSLLQ